ncbi:hypothetical protein [Vibrio sp. WXL210]|uniref:hypothetical protein n=1 Tax=Vibrio sp. WXL210 TaxID=3450709 RepID=UPI003EC7EEC1
MSFESKKIQMEIDDIPSEHEETMAKWGIGIFVAVVVVCFFGIDIFAYLKL